MRSIGQNSKVKTLKVFWSTKFIKFVGESHPVNCFNGLFPS